MGRIHRGWGSRNEEPAAWSKQKGSEPICWSYSTWRVGSLLYFICGGVCFGIVITGMKKVNDLDTTAYGELEGYTHHEVKVTGSNIQLSSIQFYEKLLELVEGKEVVYRLTPRVNKHGDEFMFMARVHIRN